jgi:hypothetical protein
MAAKSAGHWYAHGSYMQREAAAGKNGGFAKDQEAVAIPQLLQSWQAAGDPRVFKVIISPENGAHLDMHQYTRDVMAAIQKDHTGELEWVAAIHSNTDHPHVHVAIRGISREGREVSFAREYIKEGFRFHAENVATIRLGYRTEEDINKDLVKQIGQDRITSLDRDIQKLRREKTDTKTFRVTTSDAALQEMQRRKSVKAYAVGRRLQHLANMGLAVSPEPGVYDVKADYIETLRTIQAVGDKQKMLARHMEAASSTNLPVIAQQWKNVTLLQGRVLGHGELEGSEKRYMLIEGVDGKVYHLPHRKDTEELRAQRQLRRNEFVSIRRDRGKVTFVEMGHADTILKDRELLANFPHTPDADQHRPGWLGKFDQAVAVAQARLRQDRQRKIAQPLSTEQFRLLVRAEFPYDREAQESAGRRIIQDGYRLPILGGVAELEYSKASGVPFAVLAEQDKAKLDERIEQLTTAARGVQRARAERHKDQQHRE